MSHAPRLALIIALIITAPLTAFADDYTIPDTHPRIFLLKSDIPALAARCKPGQYNADDYAKMKHYADTHHPIMNHSVTSTALVYLIEKQLGHPTDTYVKYLKEHILEMAKGNMLKLNHWHNYQSMIAADWIWDEFTPAEKRQLAMAMQIIPRPNSTLDQNIAPGTWPYRYYHNKVAAWSAGPPGRVLERLIRSVCFYNEGFADAKIKEELDRCHYYITKELAPALNLSGGPDESGFDYSVPTAIWSAWQFPIWYKLGVDQWSNNIFAQEFPQWYMYSKIPFENYMIRRDDSTNSTSNTQLSPISAPIFLQAKCKAARWWIQYYNQHHTDNSTLWCRILFDDGSVPPVKSSDFPPTKFFASGEGPRKGLGLVVWRSGWDENATLFDFRCGDYYYGHQHRDTGSFIIHKAGHLAVDPGPYFTYEGTTGSEYDNNFHHAPVAHNLVALYQKDGSPIDQRIPQPSDSAYYMHKENPKKYNHGDITAYIDTQYYAYLLADITPAYNNPALKKQYRAIVYLKPDTFIILDRTLTKPNIIKRFQLQSKVQPTITTTSTTTQQIQGTPQNGITQYPNTQTFTLNQRLGRLTTTILYPTSPTLRTIGGKDFSYWVKNKNYHWGKLKNKNKSLQQYIDEGVAMFAWGRTEIDDLSPNSTFLTVLQTSLQSDPLPPTPKLTQSPTQLTTTFIIDNKTYTISFNKSPRIIGSITITQNRTKFLPKTTFPTNVNPASYQPN